MDRTQFTAEELVELKKSAFESYFDGATELPKDYAKNMSHGIAKMLRENPRLYLGFGVYWWGVKQALVDLEQEGWWTDTNSDKGLSCPTFEDPAEACFVGMIYAEYNCWQLFHNHYKLNYEGKEVLYSLVDECCEALGQDFYW